MIGDKIKIIALNCQGLGIENKRRDVLLNLRNKKYSIICLIDTHFAKSQERRLSLEWGFQAYFSSFSTQKRGVAIFFNNNFEFKIHSRFNDTNGNLLLLDIEIDEHRITLVTIYGPNKDDPGFYEFLKNKIIEMGNKDIIINGDWNILLDPQIDGINYKNINNPNARLKVLQIMTELNLYDVWRDENLEKKIYTWKKKLSPGIYQMGRLDFMLVSESLLNFTRDEDVVPGFRSDHSATTLSLNFHKIQKNKTFWKFNNSLLKNKDYVNEIKNVILKIKRQYAVTPYNLDKIELIENENFQVTLNPQLFFEILLLEIRSKTVAFSSALNKKDKDKVKLLEEEIAHLDKINSVENFETIQEKQRELNKLREKRLEGTMVRARARWIEQGEKPSKYFCSLENRNFVSKRMVSLIKDNFFEVTESNGIKNEVGTFYTKLYSSREEEITNVDLNDILNENTPKLTNDKAISIEGQMTLPEATLFLSKMKNNKSPGSSGFSVEFFKFFWND